MKGLRYFPLHVTEFCGEMQGKFKLNLTWHSMKPLHLQILSDLNTCFWSKDDSSHFKISPCFQISWTWSDVFQVNESFIQQLSAMFTWKDCTCGNLSNQANI